MKNPVRIPEMCGLIYKLWEKYPDLRFFQLVDWIRDKYTESTAGGSTFYAADDEVKEFLKRLLRKL